MSMIEVKTIERDLREKMADRLTAAQMEDLGAVLYDVLAGYDITAVRCQDQGEDYILNAYLDAIRVEGKSPKTIERYGYILKRLMDACGATTRDITVYHIRKYLGDEKARGIQDGTLNGMRGIYCSYFNWCQREGLITKNPIANIGVVRCQRKVKKAYTEVEMERLKAHCKTVRDKAIICFLYASGCRVSEVTGCNRTDVNLASGECTVLGKGNKQRIVYLDPVCCSILEEYLSTRQDDNPALFVNRYGDRLNPGGIRTMLKALGEAAGVKHVHPHKFRRTRATVLIRHGMPVQEVASILGHEKLDTTMEYVVLDQSQIRSSYQRYA